MMNQSKFRVLCAQSLVRRGDEWSQRTLTAIASRVSLKRLRDALHGSTRLAVKLEVADTLRAEIRRREWEESARRALGVRAGLTAVRDSLAEAEAADTLDSELYLRLK